MSTYLYNGIKLPALPDWDTDTYPYVHIIKTNETDGVCYYGLYMHSRSDNYVVVGPKNSWEPSYITRIYHKHDKMFVRSSFCDTNTSWAEVEISESAVDETYEYTTTMTYYPPVIWTNHDLYYEDGTLYLAASDPIPVTPSNPFCLRSWLTGFALGLAGKSYPYSVPDFDEEDSTVFEVDALWATTLPTTATLYLVDDEAYIDDDTAITYQIGESGLKLKLKGSHLIVET